MKKLIALVLGTEVVEAGVQMDCSGLYHYQYRCRNGIYQRRWVTYYGQRCEKVIFNAWVDIREC